MSFLHSDEEHSDFDNNDVKEFDSDASEGDSDVSESDDDTSEGDSESESEDDSDVSEDGSEINVADNMDVAEAMTKIDQISIKEEFEDASLLQYLNLCFIVIPITVLVAIGTELLFGVIAGFNLLNDTATLFYLRTTSIVIPNQRHNKHSTVAKTVKPVIESINESLADVENNDDVESTYSESYDDMDMTSVLSFDELDAVQPNNATEKANPIPDCPTEGCFSFGFHIPNLGINRPGYYTTPGYCIDIRNKVVTCVEFLGTYAITLNYEGDELKRVDYDGKYYTSFDSLPSKVADVLVNARLTMKVLY